MADHMAFAGWPGLPLQRGRCDGGRRLHIPSRPGILWVRLSHLSPRADMMPLPGAQGAHATRLLVWLNVLAVFADTLT